MYLNGLILNRPEVFISSAHQKVDAAGKLVDEKTRVAIGGLLKALQAWAAQVAPKGEPGLELFDEMGSLR